MTKTLNAPILVRNRCGESCEDGESSSARDRFSHTSRGARPTRHRRRFALVDFELVGKRAKLRVEAIDERNEMRLECESEGAESRSMRVLYAAGATYGIFF